MRPVSDAPLATVHRAIHPHCSTPSAHSSGHLFRLWLPFRGFRVGAKRKASGKASGKAEGTARCGWHCDSLAASLAAWLSQVGTSARFNPLMARSAHRHCQGRPALARASPPHSWRAPQNDAGTHRNVFKRGFAMRGVELVVLSRLHAKSGRRSANEEHRPASRQTVLFGNGFCNFLLPGDAAAAAADRASESDSGRKGSLDKF